MSFTFPINPERPTQSMSDLANFLGLSHIPTPPTYDDKPIDQITNIKRQQVSLDFAGKIGYGDVVSGATDINTKFFLIEYMMTRPVLAGAADEVFYSATYGAGFRIALKVRQVNVEAEINLGKLAAQAELGMIEVDVDIRVLGLPGHPAISDDLIGFKPFGQELLDSVNQTISDLQAYAKTSTSLDPVLLAVTPRRALLPILMIEGESLVYAMNRIGKAWPLRKALKKKAAGMSEELIRAIYAQVMRNPSMTIPGDVSEQEVPKPPEVTAAKGYVKQ